MIELRVIPGHDQRARTAGTAAHGCAAVGIVCELYVALLFDEGQDFVLDELGILAGHGVVFEAALAALRVAPAVADGDGDHHRQLVLGYQSIERREEHVVGAVGANDERRNGARYVLFWDIDGDLARVWRRMARGDDELCGIAWVWRAECAFIASDAGVVLAVGRIHREFDEVPFVRSGAVISGAGVWVGPMMKFPSASEGGTAPSGSSFAFTYPGVCGSRVGGAGRGVCCAGAAAGGCPKPIAVNAREHPKTPSLKDEFISLISCFPRFTLTMAALRLSCAHTPPVGPCVRWRE